MKFNNSCIMLMTSLWTGIDFYAVFDEEDLKDTGIEYDSHITAIYTTEIIQKAGVLDTIKVSLGDYWKDLESLMIENEKLKVSDYFEISKFENDSDYVIFKLREDTDLYKIMSLINKSLSSNFGVKSEFTSYTPHMTIAELEPGTASKYMFSPLLSEIYEKAVFSIDDLVISYGIEDKPGEYKQFNLTSFNAVNRYFRQKELERDRQYYASLEP